MHNKRHLKNTPEYRSGMFRIAPCPVCGHPTLDKEKTHRKFRWVFWRGARDGT